MQTTICQEKRLGDNPRITILNTEIDVLNVNETIALVEKYVQTKTPLHLMGVNADKINEVNQNAKMREIVNSCGVINADGASVILASKYMGDNKLMLNRFEGYITLHGFMYSRRDV